MSSILHSDGVQLIALSYKTDAAFKLLSVKIQSLNTPSAVFNISLSNRNLTFSEDKGNAFSAFSYHATENLIESIALPILQINYTYISQDVNNVVSGDQFYTVKGQQPHIFYGPNYFIGAYIDASGMLVFEKCSGETFQVEASGNIGYTKRYPSLSLSNDSIFSYSILAQKDAIVVHLNGHSSGEIFLFDTTFSSESAFQEIVGSWKVSSPGVIGTCSKGFYFIGPDNCQVFFQENSIWQKNAFITSAGLPAITVDNDADGFDALIYTDLALVLIKDFTQSIQTGITIEGAEKNWVTSTNHLAEVLSTSDIFLRQQIELQLSQNILHKSGNYLVMSTLIVPQDFSTPFRTKVQCFENINGVYQALPAIDDQGLFLHQSFADISKEFFPNDIVSNMFSYRRRVYYSTKTNSILLKTRNVFILPDEKYVGKTLEDIDWSTGISYTLEQSNQLAHVSAGNTQRNDKVDYTIKKVNENYFLFSSNQSLKNDIGKGQYTFQIQTEDNKTILIHPSEIEENQITLDITEDKRIRSRGEKRVHSRR